MTHAPVLPGAPARAQVSHVGVAIPIRAFALGKARLAEHLELEARAELGRRWADQVADAAHGLATVIVSSDPAVRDWAQVRSLPCLDDPGSLDAAADAGRSWAAAQGLTRVVITHADLPFAQSYAGVARDGSRPVVTIVPCHRDDGTPVLSLPVDLDFRFAYGPASFRRHAAEARRVHAAVRVVRDPALAFDVDVPDDLARLTALSLR
jgi:2-phospho-L-lactate guanylyltransferase